MNQAVRSAAPVAVSTPDLSAIKQRQQGAWASGDYAIVGTTLQIVGEMLCEAVDLRSGSARAGCCRRKRQCHACRRTPLCRCRVDGLRRGGCWSRGGGARGGRSALRSPSRLLTPRICRSRTAASMSYCRPSANVYAQSGAGGEGNCCASAKPGGKVGLANWTPESFIGRLFKTIGKYVPPAPGVMSPALWGSMARLDAMFAANAQVTAQSRVFVFRYHSPAHWLEIFRTYYGPVLKAFAAIDPKARQSLEADLLALMAEFNFAKDGTLVVPSEYLEVVITRRG